MPYVSTHKTDITPGFMFQFDFGDTLAHTDPGLWISPGPWLVICKQWKTQIHGGSSWQYLCMGPGGQLEWIGYLGEVYIISDPKSDT